MVAWQRVLQQKLQHMKLNGYIRMLWWDEFAIEKVIRWFEEVASASALDAPYAGRVLYNNVQRFVTVPIHLGWFARSTILTIPAGRQHYHDKRHGAIVALDRMNYTFDINVAYVSVHPVAKITAMRSQSTFAWCTHRFSVPSSLPATPSFPSHILWLVQWQAHRTLQAPACDDDSSCGIFRLRNLFRYIALISVHGVCVCVCVFSPNERQ